MGFLFFKSAEEKQQIAAARAAYSSVLQEVSSPPDHLLQSVATLVSSPATQALSVRERQSLNEKLVREYTHVALQDDKLTEAEEHTLVSLLGALGFTVESLGTRFQDLAVGIQIARANAGRLSTIAAPGLLLKNAEIAHAVWPAWLVKRVETKQYVGGYSGFSFRIARGVSYHVGGTRGHVVTTGTQIKTQDTGHLYITSQRIVYLGQTTTLEFLFGKLVGVDVFEDAVGIHVSNRQSAPLIKVYNGHVVAALINAACQRAIGASH